MNAGPREAATSRRRVRTLRRLIIVLGLYAGIGVSAAAWAYWGSSFAPGAQGAATAAAVNQGATPSASLTAARTVTVTWGASTLNTGQPVDGYVVRRYDAATSALQAILTNCTDTITATNCVENSVPLGQWKYSVTPVIGTNWQGAESPKSGTVVVASATLTLAKTLFVAPLPQTTTGTLTGFAVNEGVSYRLDAATGLAGSPSAVDASGNATITSLTIPSTGDGAHTVYALGNATPASQASAGIVVDTAGPIVTATLNPTANGAGWNNSAPVQVTLGADDGTGSGLSQIRYTTDGTDPTASGSSAIYSAPIPVSTNKTIRYYATDVAGNASAVATQPVNIDTAAPSNSLALSNVTGNAVLSGATVYYRGVAAGSFTLTNALSDSGGSGAASSGTAALSGTSTGWAHTSSSVGGPYVSNSFNWSAGTTASPSETVTGADAAGNTAATTLTYVDDSTGPNGGSVDATGLVGIGNRYSTSTTLSIAVAKGTDSGAGLAASGAKLFRASATLSNGVCGAYGAYGQIAADPASPVSDTVTDQACYGYLYAVADLLGNTTTYASGDVKVDTTPPATPTLSFSNFTNTYWSGAGSTVYYRSNASSGSFTATGSSTDPASGILGWTYPPLGTNWTSTTGGSGVVVYSWSGVPAAPATTSMYVVNQAGLQSASTAFTLTDDVTAPNGGSVGYLNGYTTGATVNVTVSAGTDAGSSVNTGSGLLQRASAPLTSGACGTFGAFTTIKANPASPYTDGTVGNGNCYQYRYLVSDNVGNQATYISASIVKADYAGAVSNTAGLVSQWRLDESTTESDSFTGAAGTTLQTHTADTGATWTKFGATNDAAITDVNRLRKNASGAAHYYSSATPASANYAVEADVLVKSVTDHVGLVGRQDTTNANGTYYLARYVDTGSWELAKVINGTLTSLGTYAQTLTAGQAYRLHLDMNGSTISLWVDGASRVSVTDAAITAAGRAGIRLGYAGSAITPTNTTGLHLDNFTVQPHARDSKGTNNGGYFYGPTLGVAGALPGDPNTAVRFDGVNDSVVGPQLVLDDFSVELWFTSTQGTGTGPNWYNCAALVDADRPGANNDWGTSLCADGRVIAGVGNPDTSIVSTNAGYNDGVWHHMVFTRASGGAMALYVDGASVGTATGPAGPRNNAPNMTFGQAATGAGINMFAGSLDEVAIYNQVLSAATVGDHYGFRPGGPYGGSVDATGLVGTGGRYSTSTTLSVAFTAGTDPNGMASSGFQLKRATATLTNGACGAYGAYTQVGVDDPTSPTTDTVADQACYRYQYIVADTLGNPTTYTSGDIKVDTTAPAAPTLSFSSFANAYASGNMVYHRSNAANGSFTTTANSTDAASGIAGYAFPALGTNWTSTPGTLGVNTYSWSGAPAAPGSPTVTATSNAGAPSPATSFTMTSDTTVPGGGNVTYVDGNSPGGTVSVTFAAGTDAGSGVNPSSGLLQRAAAPLVAGTCGSYSAFATIATNPTSPYTDNTATTGYCYQYKYLVSDNVGNQATYSSASVAKVDYSVAVSSTGNLVSYWRMGADPTAADTFSGATGGLLSAHTPDIGGAWVKHVDASVYNTAVISNENRLRKSGNKNAWYYNNTAPPSANYAVEADIMMKSATTDDYICLLGRNNGTVNVWYEACYSDSSKKWELWENGPTLIGSTVAQTLTVGQTYRLRLDMNGSTISVWVDGVQKISAIDASIAAAGYGGVQFGSSSATSAPTDTTGWQMDSWRIVPNTGTTLADSKGTNNGTFSGPPMLNVPGALVNDANTAVQFSTSTQYASVPNNATLNLGAAFTVEAWVRRRDYGTGAQVMVNRGTNGYKLSITGNKLTLSKEGGATIVQSTALANDTTSFHHYAVAKTGTGAANVHLYVDGVEVTDTSTYSLANDTITTSTGTLYIGSRDGATEALNGAIDEVALYNRALTGTEISDHNRLGRGI